MEKTDSEEMSHLSKALHRAVSSVSVLKVKFQLWRGASVNARDNNNRTALHLACQSKVKDMLSVVNLLLRSEADVNVQDKDERTPLHEICSKQDESLNKNNYIDQAVRQLVSKYKHMQKVIDLLLVFGAKVNVQNNEGKTPLHVVILEMNQTVLLTQSNSLQGMFVGSVDNHGMTLLDIEMQSIIVMLLGSGADVNIQDKDGRTPLHEACDGKNLSLVPTLMRNGAKIGVVDNKGQTPVHVACDRSLDTVSYEYVVNTLLGNKEAVDYDESSSQYLSNLSENGEVPYVINLQDKDGNTVLHIASRERNKDVVSVLLLMGAKVGVKNKDGLTALHFAVSSCAWDVADVLVDHGEDVNAKDCDGNTPLHLVCNTEGFWLPARHTYYTIEKMLCKEANILTKNNALETPYESLHRLISSRYYFLDSEEIRIIEGTFIKHAVKLKELKPHVTCDIQWKLGLDFYQTVNNRCVKELEDMKSIKIVKDITVYEVLSHTIQLYLHLSSVDLLRIDKFLCSLDLIKIFPLYNDLLKTKFQRDRLLTLALRSFYAERRNQTVKNLPCEITEQLLAYLSIEDLKNFVKSEEL